MFQKILNSFYLLQCISSNKPWINFLFYVFFFVPKLPSKDVFVTQPIQSGAKVGLQLCVHEIEFILALLFLNYHIIFHTLCPTLYIERNPRNLV